MAADITRAVDRRIWFGVLLACVLLAVFVLHSGVVFLACGPLLPRE